MIHDPWTLHAALSCPSCHVVGKVVRDESDVDYDLDQAEENPFVCVDCGQTWLDAGVAGDVKEYRVQYMRLVEGRPYEPPKPKEPVKSKVDFSAFDGLLADYWRKDIEERLARPPLDFSKLKKSAHTWSLGVAGWHRPAEILLPAQVVAPEPPKDAVPGTYRVTKVCQATGTIIVERETAMPTEKRDALLATTWAMPDDAMAVPQISKTPQTGVYAGALPNGAELQSVAVDPATGDVTIRYTKK